MRTVLAVMAVLATASIQAQQPQFEAVSIRVNRSGSQSSGVGPRPDGGVRATNSTVRSLIRWAWELNTLELVGGPAWIDQDRFDIVATAIGNPDLGGTRALMRAMLQDRFKLAVRNERRQLPIYALVVARADGRLGPSLRRSTADCRTAFCGSRIDTGVMASTGILLDDFAQTMATRAGRIIVNRTGLAGTFDLELKFNPDPGAGGAAAGDLPAFFTAVEEQLGLKLEADSGDVPVVIIASVEKPSEN